MVNQLTQITVLEGRTEPETAGPFNCVIIIQCLHIMAPMHKFRWAYIMKPFLQAR